MAKGAKMRCNNCGAENEAHARFCKACGHQLIQERDHKTRRPKTVLIVLVAVISLCLVASAVFLILRLGMTPNPVPEPSKKEAAFSLMADANGGKDPDVYFDETRSVVHYIDGRFTKRKINGFEDAIASVGDIAELYGIEDSQQELRLQSVDSTLSGSTFYRLQQYHNDVPVYGCQLIVCADGEGNASTISGVFDGGILEQEGSAITSDQAAEVVSTYGEELTGQVWQVYYSSTGVDSRLCWLVECAGKQVFVDAFDGSIVGVECTVYTEKAEGSGKDIENNQRTFDTRKNASSKYELMDEERNILAYDVGDFWSNVGNGLGWYGSQHARWEFFDAAGNEVIALNGFSWNASERKYSKVYSWTSSTAQPAHWNYLITTNGDSIDNVRYGIQDLDTSQVIIDNLRIEIEPCKENGDVVLVTSDDDNKWSDGNSVSALANIERAYQEYERLGRRGFDGSGNTEMQVWFNINWKNACSSFGGQVIQFGKNMPTLECAMHEYTHSIEQNISEMRYIRESGALMEAYSDIMALSLTNSSTWQYDGIRDPSNPSSMNSGTLKYPSVYKGGGWDTRYELMSDEDIESNDANDHGNVHTHCTVISHAAYLMHDAGISNQDISRLWYESFYYLDPNADFYTCRYAVISAARKLGFSDENIARIEDAFNEVGIARIDSSAINVAPDATVFVEDTDGNRLEAFTLEIKRTTGRFENQHGETAYSAASHDGRVDMQNDFESEPETGRYFFDVKADGATQQVSPIITVKTNGVKELVITVVRNDSKQSNQITAKARDIALVLDVSGSMAGEPLEATKEAAKSFIDIAATEDARVGVVTFSSVSEVLASIDTSPNTAKTAIEGLTDGGGTNMEAGLESGSGLLGTSTQNKRILVLMSDGEPNGGKTGKELISYAQSLRDSNADGKEELKIYAVGFNESTSGQKLLASIASPGCHYEVQDSSDLEAFFADIADEINGTRFIYARVACPVDVTVKLNGETLSSSGENPQTRTSFGSLSFEEEQSDSGSSRDTVKVLRLREGESYDISIEGYDTGVMDYSIGFLDEEGDYSDFRTFSDVDVSKDTFISTKAEVSDETRMDIDEDGDGRIDRRLVAGPNEEAKPIDNGWIVRVVFAVFALVGLCIVSLVLFFVYRKRKNRGFAK